MGRYSYYNQPSMGVYAVRKLGEALHDLIGAEEELQGGQVGEGWGDLGSEEGKMENWRKAGLEIVEEACKDFTTVFSDEYRRLLAKVRPTS
jgi:serine/tyrosine/threonine adenylyltransferase